MKKIALFYVLLTVFVSLNIFAEDEKILPELNDNLTDYSFASDLEIEVINELNIARTHPKFYADLLTEYRKYYSGKYLDIPGRVTIATNEGTRAVDEAIQFLKKQLELNPFRFSKGMSLGAKDHVTDQGPTGATGHNGSDGSSPFDRVNRYGKWQFYAGENIDYGNKVAREIVFSLIIDDGVRSRGHRKNIFNPRFTTVGVACGKHAVYNYMCVMTFAQAYLENEAKEE
ncbi:MAG TPA: CAP domain-containing protein [Spirochaetota bacterium]|nr:CAP domain-containing protein [Spirochaetota bacterium]HOS32901.1 CAP domain-containing protein [Spirochaetota bacterium]HOS56087.1 CAP domain-containing protein [Spirochaetota bacterium]HPK62734.1 CAP domain-containing protein [Spirochaetota bacterium]HQF76824.1 CAP domain-containing protein [Spirochaetota bacterium]